MGGGGWGTAEGCEGVGGGGWGTAEGCEGVGGGGWGTAEGCALRFSGWTADDACALGGLRACTSGSPSSVLPLLVLPWCAVLLAHGAPLPPGGCKGKDKGKR